MIKEGFPQQSTVIRAIFTPNDGSHPLKNHLMFTLQQQGITPESLFSLDSDRINKMAVNLARKLPYKPDMSFPLGVLCSLMPSNQYTNKLIELCNPIQQENSLQVEPFFRTARSDHWYLCPEAEALMLSSIYNNAIIAVDNSLLLMFQGRLTAYCFRPLLAQKGIFIPGNFYSPTDQDSRTFYKQAFSQGTSGLTRLDGSWAIMRGVENVDREFLAERVNARLQTLPIVFPETIANVPRPDYCWLALEGQE